MKKLPMILPQHLPMIPEEKEAKEAWIEIYVKDILIAQPLLLKYLSLLSDEALLSGIIVYLAVENALCK